MTACWACMMMWGDDPAACPRCGQPTHVTVSGPIDVSVATIPQPAEPTRYVTSDRLGGIGPSAEEPP